MTLKGVVWSPRGPSPMNENTQQDNGLVSAIAVSPNNPDVIYIGTAGGGVWRSAQVRRVTREMRESGSCTMYGECEAVCPKEISTDFIARMNRDYLSAKFRTRKSEAEG